VYSTYGLNGENRHCHFFEGVFNNKKILNAKHRFYLKEISKKLYIGFKNMRFIKSFTNI